MPELVKYCSEMVDLSDGDDLTSFALTFDNLKVSHSEGGKLVLKQSFICEVTDLLDDKQLKSYYPDKRTIRVKALHYTKGITNKKRFSENLQRLRSEGRMEEAAYLELSEMIKEAHCPPIKLLERLMRMGHNSIAKELDFYDEDPLLEKSIDLLHNFIYNINKG